MPPHSQPSPSDLPLLLAAIRRDFPRLDAPRGAEWGRSPALKVIDCVLSLNRPYDSFVTPRVERFAREHAEVRTCGALLGLIDAAASPAEFMRHELDYRDAGRAETLRGVVEFVCRVQEGRPGRDEAERLAAWAREARPADHRRVGVRGFGLAGFQYLRMLFGAEATKPDVHIIAYVSRAVGRERPMSAIAALELLEAAARAAGVSLRSLDVAIWERGARDAGGEGRRRCRASAPA